jgi:hypothetical protein
MFEEAESRRVFDAAAKNTARGKSDRGKSKLQGWFLLILFLAAKKIIKKNKKLRIIS